MIDERHEELAALAALDLCDPAERAEFQAAVAHDPSLARRVEELREAACALAHLAPACELPAGLKERILESAAASPRAARPRARVLPFAVLVPWALAAGLAVAAAWSAERYLALRSETALLRDQQQLAQVELQQVRNQIAAERIVSQRELADNHDQLVALGEKLADASRQANSSLAQLASLSGQLRVANNLMRLKIVTLEPMRASEAKMPPAVALWDSAKQEGMLDVKLPALAANKDYQLWAIDPQYGAPVDSGVFQVDPVTCTACITFHPTKPIKVGTRFAISLERKGGVPKAEGPIIMVSD